MIRSDEKMHINKELCEKCSGNCCKTLPGHYLPSEFSEDTFVPDIVDGIIGGLYILDYAEIFLCCRDGKQCTSIVCETCSRSGGFSDGWDTKVAWFIRVPGTEEYIHHKRGVFYMGGPCSHLTDRGCRLPPSKRPYFCRILIPSQEKCYRSKKDVPKEIWEYTIDKWGTYQDQINEVREIVDDFKLGVNI